MKKVRHSVQDTRRSETQLLYTHTHSVFIQILSCTQSYTVYFIVLHFAKGAMKSLFKVVGFVREVQALSALLVEARIAGKTPYHVVFIIRDINALWWCKASNSVLLLQASCGICVRCCCISFYLLETSTTRTWDTSSGWGVGMEVRMGVVDSAVLVREGCVTFKGMCHHL